MANPVQTASDVPGGEFLVSGTPTALDPTSTRSCLSITMRADPANSVAYWGYDDMTAGANRRGFILGSEPVVIPGPVAPSSIFVYGTAGNIIFWSTVRQ